MIDQLQFWQVPPTTLKDKIKRCKCGKRLFGRKSECNPCHKDREKIRRKTNRPIHT